MGRVVHFELSADDMERAGNFYRTVFDWKVIKWEGPQEYWLIDTGDGAQTGINGGLMKKHEGLPATINTIDVADLDSYVEKVTQNGGSIVMPKMAVPGVGYMAYCRDTEGNTFGMMQADSDAK